MKTNAKHPTNIGTAALSALALVTIALVTIAQAHAQSPQAPSQSAQLEEVVVTARQRVERIEDVPATIRAFSSSEIAAARIERPADFLLLTPGVSQVQTLEVGDFQVNIRGINSGRDTESSVALVIDGILMTNPNTLNRELDNIAQIEVLKGPQGAIYGRNALAGAIILTTNRPSDTFETEVSGGVGNNSMVETSLRMSGPIGDRITAGVSAYYQDEGGSFENSFKGCDDCVNFIEEEGISGRSIFQLNETSELDLKARYSKVKAGGVAFNAALALRDAAEAGFGELFWEDPNDHDFLYINRNNPDNEQTNLNLSALGRFDFKLGTLTALVSYNDVENYFLSAGTSNSFGIYNANETCQQEYAAAVGAIPVPAPFFYTPDIANSFLPPYPPISCGGYQYQQRDQKDAAVEIRFSSNQDQQLRWMAGTYVADVDRHLVVSYGGDLGGGADTFQRGFVPSTGPNPTDLLFDDDLLSTIYAVFGSIDYDLTDTLELGLALRYDIEDREVENNVPKLAPQTPGFGAFGAPVCPDGPEGCTYFINPFFNANPELDSIPTRKESFRQLQPKVSLTWQPTEQWTVFSSWGLGFRSGGFNSSGTTATLKQFFGDLQLTDGTPNLNDLSDSFDKEIAKTVELGFKGVLLNNSLSINGALFYTQSDDMQDFSFFAGPFGSLRVVTNIDEAQIQGAELDFRWKATNAVTLFGGIGFTDTEIKKYSTRPYTEGNKLPYIPEYTGNLGAELYLTVGKGHWDFRARLDGVFTGKTWFSPVQENYLPNSFTAFGFGSSDFSRQQRDAFAFANLTLTFSNKDWAIDFWGKNITDEDYLEETIPAPEFGGSFIHDSYGRMYGASISYTFGSN